MNKGVVSENADHVIDCVRMIGAIAGVLGDLLACHV